MKRINNALQNGRRPLAPRESTICETVKCTGTMGAEAQCTVDKPQLSHLPVCRDLRSIALLTVGRVDAMLRSPAARWRHQSQHSFVVYTVARLHLAALDFI